MFIGQQVILRSFELTDVPVILQHFNKWEVRRFLDNPTPHSPEEEEQWIRNTWEARKTGRAYFFAIEHKKSKKLIGGCGLFALQSRHRSAELMIVIYSKKHWGDGLGTEALHLLLNFGFTHINLRRIYLLTHEFNKRAQKTYEKLGFRQMGRRRQFSYVEGQYYDLLYYDLLSTEYQPHS